MKIVEYAPEYGERLSSALARAGVAHLLQSDAYRRHYYLGHACCRLYLLLADDGDIVATLGSERVHLRIGGEKLEAAVGSNTFSLRVGALSFLLVHWGRSNGLAVMLPSMEGWSAMLARQPRWHRIPGLKSYFLNWGYPILNGDPLWKKALKPLVRSFTRVNPEAFVARIGKSTGGSLRVAEESGFSEDMLAESNSFGLKLEPDVDYLNWRFCPTLDYVRYRIFRILNEGRTRGHLVLAEWPRCLIVSHCDGEDPEELALGVLLAISAVNRGGHRYRMVLLTSRHCVMSRVFSRFGFRPKKEDTPLYVAAFGNQEIPSKGKHDWLVNMDWADYGVSKGMFASL